MALAPTRLTRMTYWASALAFAVAPGLAGEARAQCPGAFHANSGSGVHATASPNAGVHPASSVAHRASGPSSCAIAASPTARAPVAVVRPPASRLAAHGPEIRKSGVGDHKATWSRLKP